MVSKYHAHPPTWVPWGLLCLLCCISISCATYYAGSGHDGKPFSYELCKFFGDLEALVLFVNNVNTMQFDDLIAGGCSKHHMALIPLFPVTVSWTMYEKTSNQNKDFLIWKDKQPNVRVCSRYLTLDEAKTITVRDRKRPLLFLVRLDTAQGTHKKTRALEESVKRDL